MARDLRQANKSGNEHRAATIARDLDLFDQRHGDHLNALADERLRKSIQKLPERLARAQAKHGGQILGKVASSIAAKIKKGTLTLESKIPWSAVHNDGGTAGHGSAIPGRTFLEWTEADFEDFTRMAQDRMLAAFHG